jgi:hypothetical protein
MELPNHHLWWNRGSWWVAFSVLHDGYRQERIRRPLGTKDAAEARIRRDRMMDALRNTPGCRLLLRGSQQAARQLSNHASNPQLGVTHD